MDITKDYYSILGILPSAEVAVIKAAYKAMMTIYHPDKYQHDKEYAHKRSIEIKEAYDVLSDGAKRAQYDEARTNCNAKSSFAYDEQTQKASTTLDNDWEIATKYHPNLDIVEKSLKEISPELAFSFRLRILENKEFNNIFDISDSMEKEYFKTYFGSHHKINDFAKYLLVSGFREAASRLNKAVSIIGSNIDVEHVISRISIEFEIPEMPDEFKEKEDLFNRKKKFENEQIKDGKEKKQYLVVASLVVVFVVIAVASS